MFLARVKAATVTLLAASLLAGAATWTDAGITASVLPPSLPPAKQTIARAGELGVAPPALAQRQANGSADSSKIDKSIGKQPAYRTAPEYGLLVFGSEGKDRVWLVRDGDALYVDRNGNGDLTDPREKILAEKRPASLPDGDRFYVFNVGDLSVGQRTHKGLRVRFAPLASLPQVPQAGSKKAAKTMCVAMELDVDVPGMKGGGAGGRLKFEAGPVDSSGVLEFGKTPAQAPVIHLDGPLQITFFLERPKLQAGRSTELTLVVGTPGTGAGTFAMLAYEGTIPESAKPIAEIRYPSAKPGDPPPRQRFEIKERC